MDVQPNIEYTESVEDNMKKIQQRDAVNHSKMVNEARQSFNQLSRLSMVMSRESLSKDKKAGDPAFNGVEEIPSGASKVQDIFAERLSKGLPAKKLMYDYKIPDLNPVAVINGVSIGMISPDNPLALKVISMQESTKDKAVETVPTAVKFIHDPSQTKVLKTDDTYVKKSFLFASDMKNEHEMVDNYLVKDSEDLLNNGVEESAQVSEQDLDDVKSGYAMAEENTTNMRDRLNQEAANLGDEIMANGKTEDILDFSR